MDCLLKASFPTETPFPLIPSKVRSLEPLPQFNEGQWHSVYGGGHLGISQAPGMCVISNSRSKSTQLGHQILHYKLHEHLSQPLFCFLPSQSLWQAVRKRSLLELMHILFIIQTRKNRYRNYLPTSYCHQPLLTGRKVMTKGCGQKAHDKCSAPVCTSATLLETLPHSFFPRHPES